MIVFAGVASLIIWGMLLFLSHGIDFSTSESIRRFLPNQLVPYLAKVKNGFGYDIPNKEMPAEIFFFLFIILFIIYLAVVFKSTRSPNQKNNIIVIFFFAILFRIILTPSIPVYENDIYRYLWDGKVFAAAINPYKYEPRLAEIKPADEELKAPFARLKKLRNDNYQLFARVGHRWVPTIYPPVAQSIFLISHWIKKDSIVAMKIIFSLIDLMTVFFLYKLLQFFKLNTNMVVVYAWSPLVLKEFANSGHYDVIPILLLVLSLYYLFRSKTYKSLFLLAAGCLAKYFPIVLMPLFFKKVKIKGLFVVFLTIMTGWIPFVLWGGAGITRVFKGMVIFSKQWSTNAGIYEFVYAFFLSLGFSNFVNIVFLSKIILAAMYFILLIIIYRKPINSNLDFLRRVFFALVGLFLLSPVGNPWYYCWVIPFLCFFPYKSLLFLSGSLIFNYLYFSFDIKPFTFLNFSIDLVILIQYFIFYLFFIFELKQKKHPEILSVSRS